MSYFTRLYFPIENFTNPQQINQSIPTAPQEQCVRKEIGPYGESALSHISRYYLENRDNRQKGYQKERRDVSLEERYKGLLSKDSQAERCKVSQERSINGLQKGRGKSSNLYQENNVKQAKGSQIKKAPDLYQKKQGKDPEIYQTDRVKGLNHYGKENAKLVYVSRPQQRAYCTGHSILQWNYNCNVKDKVCPKDWPNMVINGEKNECGNMGGQSPVNLYPSDGFPNFSLDYQVTRNSGKIINLGSLIRIEVLGDNTISLDGKKYKLHYIDLHTPSEHLIGSLDYDLEFQFIHFPKKKKEINDGFNCVVLSILLDSDERDPSKINIWDVINNGYPLILPKDNNPMVSQQNRLNLQQVSRSVVSHPKSRYYHYNGSLTVPPCTSNVKWILITSQYHCFKFDQNLKSIVGHNNRPLQKRDK